MHFPLSAWITLATLLLYVWIVMKVGKARKTFSILAPSVDGPPEFLRTLRVQANSVEQMVLFLPALWMCALCLNDLAAAFGGVIWLIGRTMYAIGYYREAAKRGLGFALSSMAALGLLVAAAYGLLR